MARRRIVRHKEAVKLYYFNDPNHKKQYGPDEYRIAKEALKAGHYIEAHCFWGEDLKHTSFAPILSIKRNRFTTAYASYRYIPF